MKKRSIIAALLLTFLFNVSQAQVFGIAGIAGVNLCQINGDNQRGFKKVGATAGVRSIINLEERWQLNAEILYSQRGASPSDARNITINLNYVETPIYLSFLISDYEATGIFRAYAGASFGRLVSYETKEIYRTSNTIDGTEILSLQESATYFNKNDVGIFAGIQLLPLDDHIGIDLRQTFSANLLFNPTEVGRPIHNEALRSYFFSIRFFYEINGIGDKKKKRRRRR
ncbi:MAG: hypothetical protein DWQ02_23265 [Bacteroidetes bacterium]|nr:MAG: hypothetical protein DWQ02_23265 [Bacteroidota bacterium]